MRKNQTIISLFSLFLFACQDEPEESPPFDSVGNDVQEGGEPGDGNGEDGDGDGDAMGDGDGDGEGESGDGDGDQCGNFGDQCSGDTCCDGLACVDGACGLGGGEGDGDGDGEGESGEGDGDPEADPWNPNTCQPPSQVLKVNGLEGNFCSSPCAGNSDCPLGPDDTQAVCALSFHQDEPPSFCALTCELANDTCPAGSTCKDLMDPVNPGIGLCTYP